MFCRSIFFLLVTGLTTSISAQILDPLVITANRDARPRSTLPVTVDVLSADDLNASPALALDDQLKASAAFRLFRRGGSLSANPTAQGVSLRNVGPSGAGRTLVLVDGIPLNDPFGGWVTWAKTSRLNLGAVEMVRGGGSGTWGSAALGGTIQVLSQPAGETSRTAVQFEAGDFGTIGGEIATTQVAGSHAFSFNARGFHSDGFRRKAPGSAGSIDRPTDLDQGFLELGWTHRNENGTTAKVTVRGFGEDRGNGTPLQANRTREMMLAGSIDGQRDLFGAPAQWSTSAYVQTQEYRSLFTAVDDARETERPVLDQYSVPADAAGAAATASWKSDQTFTSLGIDARWVEGETQENYFRVGDDFIRNRHAGGTQTTAGLFATHNRELASDWRLDLGARVDAWQLSDGHRREIDRRDGSVVRDDVIDDRSDVEFNPRVGLTWQASDQWHWQAAAYQAYRLPTLNELYRPFRVGSVITEANPDLKTEQLNGFEMGATWRSETATFRITGFINEVEDAVANVTLGFGPGFVPGAGFVPAGGVGRQRQNLNRITIEGIEFAGEWQPTNDLSLRADYLYTDARNTADDLILPQVSRHTFVAGANWQFAPAWRLTAQMRYVSDAFEDDGNTLVLDDATTFDLRIGWQLSASGEVYLAMENVTDEDVVIGRTVSGLIDLGTPRFVRTGIRWEW